MSSFSIDCKQDRESENITKRECHDVCTILSAFDNATASALYTEQPSGNLFGSGPYSQTAAAPTLISDLDPSVYMWA